MLVLSRMRLLFGMGNKFQQMGVWAHERRVAVTAFKNVVEEWALDLAVAVAIGGATGLISYWVRSDASDGFIAAGGASAVTLLGAWLREAISIPAQIHNEMADAANAVLSHASAADKVRDELKSVVKSLNLIRIPEELNSTSKRHAAHNAIVIQQERYVKVIRGGRVAGVISSSFPCMPDDRSLIDEWATIAWWADEYWNVPSLGRVGTQSVATITTPNGLVLTNLEFDSSEALPNVLIHAIALVEATITHALLPDPESASSSALPPTSPSPLPPPNPPRS